MNNAKTSEVTFSMIFGGGESIGAWSDLHQSIDRVHRTDFSSDTYLTILTRSQVTILSYFVSSCFSSTDTFMTLFFFSFPEKSWAIFFTKKETILNWQKKKKKTPDHNICPQFIFDSGFWIWKWDKNYMYRESFIQTYFLFVQQFRIQGLDGRVWSELMSATASFMIIGSTLIDPNPKP